MKPNRLRKIVYSILAAMVIVCLTVSETLLLFPEAARAQESPGGKITCEGNENNTSIMNVDDGRLQWISQDFDPPQPYRPLVDEPWSPNVKVNDDPGSATQQYPGIAVDPSGNAYAVWVDYRKGEGHYGHMINIYSSYRPAGGSWEPNVIVNDPRWPGGSMSFCPAIAVDPSGNAYVVWGEEGGAAYHSGIYFSYRPRGASWGPEIRVSDDDLGLGRHPAIAVDSSGNAYAVWCDDRDGDSHVYFSYRPSGESWGGNIRVSDGPVRSDVGAVSIALDPSGNAYALWVDERNGCCDIYSSYRPVGGSWGPNVRVNDDPRGAGKYHPSIAVDSSGNAYAVWQDYRSPDHAVYFSYRPAGGNWVSNVKVSDRWGESPSIAVDSHGNAYALWGAVGATFSYRPVGGSWGPEVEVSDHFGVGAEHTSIAVDCSGNAYAVWEDSRNDIGPSVNTDIYFSYWQRVPLPPAEEVTPEPGQEAIEGEIAYVGTDGNIWLTNADGTGQRRLTSISSDLIIFSPAWCPDGRRIVYDVISETSNEWWCEIVDINGNDLGRLPTDGNCDTPACYDDKIVFHDYRCPCMTPQAGGNPCGDIYVADLEEGEVTRLTDEHHNVFADWSRDGTRIAYVSYRGDEPSGIHTLNSDGSGERMLVETVGATAYPSWSPAGDRIAFWVSQEGLYIVNSDGTGLTQVPNIHSDEWDWTRVGWSPDGRLITISDRRGVWILGVDGSGLRRIADGKRPAWRPIPGVDLSDLLGQKQSSAEFLARVGYNEQPSRELLDSLKARANRGEHLSSSDLSALQRLVLTEELLTGFYPHYARASADTGEAFTSFVLILFGFVKALRMVEASLPDNLFTRPAKALIAKIIEKLIDLINHGFEFLEYRIIPSELRPTFHNLRQLLWAYAKAHIMEPEDPFGPGGEALAKLISDPELGISRDNILLSGYQGRTQSLIDDAVLTADPDSPEPDPLVVLPPDASARLRMEWALTNVEHWSEYHHSNYQAFKEAASIPALAADVADIASLTGVLAPIAQVVARASDLMELLLTGYGGYKSWQFLNCLEESAREAQARIYDTSLLLEIPPACEKARKLGLFAPSRSLGIYAWPTVQPLASLKQESEEYERLLEQVIVALESEDRETLADLVPQLLDADEELSQALDLVTAPILATGDDETSEQLFSQGVSFDLDTILLYAHLADELLVPEEASFTQAEDQAHIVATSLDCYQQLIATMQLAPTEPKPVPILLISSISIPEEITVDREFTLGVEVANVGAVAASGATLVVNTDEGMEPRETSAPLGYLEAESTSALTFRLTPSQEGTSLIILTLSSEDGSLVSRFALVEALGGGGPSAVMPRPSSLWPWVGGVGLLALIFLSLLAVGCRARWRRKMPSEAIVRVCPNCGASNVTAAKFCINCGRPLAR